MGDSLVIVDEDGVPAVRLQRLGDRLFIQTRASGSQLGAEGVRRLFESLEAYWLGEEIE